MEIYSAAVHVKKVNEYLESLLTQDTKMYTKTKQRLHELGVELSKGLDLISQILEEEALVCDGEFDTDRTELSEVVTDLYNNSKETSMRMENLNKFVTNGKDSISNVSNLDDLKLTSSKRKFIISKYGKVLRSVASATIEYPKVAACAHLLWRWFDSRFFLTAKICPKFKYNIRRFPEWVRDIVIAYGYSVTCGTDDKFILDFNNWCDSLLNSDVGDKYAVPFNVYNVDANMSPDKVTCAALGIWDILFDHGLDALTDESLQGLSLSEYSVSDLFRKYNDAVTDCYTYCNGNDELLKQYKLIGGEQ